MPPNETSNTVTEVDVPLNDLGPLAWVLEELRKAIAGATRSMRRFAQETRGLMPSELESFDASQLRIARQHLHQASGAAEMVGQAPIASLFHAMEAVTQHFARHPSLCTDESVNRIERAGFGLMQYLEAVLNGKSISAVALFPQYRDLQALAGNDRVHPADLWSVHWAWQDPEMPHTVAPLSYETQAKAHFEQAILQCIKSQDVEAARFLRDLSLGFAAAQHARQPLVFWKLCAAFFEANALGLSARDVHVKRATSRILQQFSALVRGELGVPDRLAQDILFFCAQARPGPNIGAPCLNAVRQAFGVTSWVPVDYERSPFGSFDPALLVQARKRIASVKEAWSAVAGNELARLRGLVDQFSLVSDSLLKLHPQSSPLAICLRQAADATVRGGVAPSPALAMEVATAVMFLEAAFEELDPNDQQLAKRTARLAQRLQRVQSGGQPEPLEPWIEELYHRVSDRQTMGSVVGELRGSLDEIERTLDQFFRTPNDAKALSGVPGQLTQMRGVLSVLGLDHAGKSVMRMRQTVETLLATEPAAHAANANEVFNSLGNNLGALGLLFDMLSYQPVLAKKLFVFNERLGELQPLMGRMATSGPVKPLAPEGVPVIRVAPIPTVSRQVPTVSHQIPTLTPANPAPTEDHYPPFASTEMGGSAPEQDFVPTGRGWPDFKPSVFAPAPAPADSGEFSLPESMAYQGGQSPVAKQPAAPAPVPTPMFELELPDESPKSVFSAEPEPVAPVHQPVAPVAASAAFVPAVASPVAPVSPVAPLPSVFTPTANEPTQEEQDAEDAELQGIFLDEAREVVQTGKSAIAALVSDPSNLDHLTALRRAFHTLKGSSRMVGLNDFGEAAWSMEQVLNAWLADRKSATHDLRALSGQALDGFAQWTHDVEDGAANLWTPRAFQVSADAMRLENRFVPLNWRANAASVAAPELPDVVDIVDLPVEPVALAPQAAETVEPAPLDADDLLQAFLDGQVPADKVGQPAPLAPLSLPDLPSLDLSLDTPAELAEPLAPNESADITADLDFNFDHADELSPEELARQFFVEEIASAPTMEAQSDTPTLPPVPDNIEDEIALVLGEPSVLQPVSDPAPALDVTEVHEDVAEDLMALHRTLGAAMPEPVAPFGLDETEEQTKVIGTLRISIPLYNVYLNEADEWSRRLQTELSEWAMELHRPLGDGTVGLAHSLAGSSATIGFAALSRLSRLLEHALQSAQLQDIGTHEQAQVFNDAAEEIRRLLHQFAAGFLKEPKAVVVQNLEFLASQIPGEKATAAPAHAVPPGSAATLTTPLPPPPAAVAFTPAVQSGTPQIVSFAAEPVAPVAPALPVVSAPVSAPLRPPAPSAPAVSTPVQPTVQKVAVDDAADEEGEFEGQDSLDFDLFPLFEEEAQDLLPQLGGALRQWVARPDNVSARAEALRVLHTLKGSARLAGAIRLGERAHRMESAIERLGAKGFDAREAAPGGQLDALLGRFDTLQASFDSLRTRFAQMNQAEAAAALDAPAATVLPIESQPVSGPAELSAAVVSPAIELPGAPTPAVILPEHDPTTIAAPATTQAPVRQTGQAVRIRSQLLDRLVNQTGEVMMTRARLEAGVGQMRSSLSDLTDNLDRLRQQLRDIELQAELQMQSRMALTKEIDRGFDPLEFDRFTRVQELTRMMAESVNDVATVQRSLLRTVDTAEADLIAQGRQTRELQRDLLHTRMIEFETIVERLYRVVRQAGKDCGKQVKLDITGGSIEMDRGVLDRMTPAFEHLLRNAVAHGIESPARREAAGKPLVGSISIVLNQEGNDVSVSFADDGAGLNHEAIRTKALAMGLIEPDQQLSTDEMIRLVFMPGVTTVAQVTELAGRGIGMDVVRSEVLALGGRIESETHAGKGTQFKLVLPLTTAVTQVVMLRAGRLAFGAPANLVELVRRINSPDLAQAYSTGSYAFGSENLPFFWSGSLLQTPGVSEDLGMQSGTVVILRSAQQRVALHVDEVLGNHEVVVKNLGPQLSGMPGLSGMTVLASGAVVLIYNPVALAAVYGNQARQYQMAQVAAAGSFGRVPTTKTETQNAGVPLVLVVDDSITVRRVTQRLLQREGYRVALAVDGVQALERLREEIPAVVLSDIEMPRMDGFELARTIRTSDQWKSLPIITITSRMAEKHREHAREIGVNHYLGKPYSEEELLGLIRRYAQAHETA